MGTQTIEHVREQNPRSPQELVSRLSNAWNATAGSRARALLAKLRKLPTIIEGTRASRGRWVLIHHVRGALGILAELHSAMGPNMPSFRNVPGKGVLIQVEA